MIQYCIYNIFYGFCKNSNLETENMNKINPSYHGVQWNEEKNFGNIQLIYLGVNEN